MAVSFAILCLSSSFAADDGKKAVDELVRTSVDIVLNTLKDKQRTKEEKREQVMKVIDPLFDIPLMAKLVLGRKYWPKFTEAQRKEFTGLFIKTLQDSYFDKVDLLTEEYVEFEKPALVEDKYYMLTYIVTKIKRYKMLFKLYKKKDLWMVYDVEIEGVSFVKSYSAQYDQFLQKNTVKDLLTKLSEKTLDIPEELKAKKKEENSQDKVEKSTP